MKIAYFSPLNPVQSGISDYSEELLPQLAEYAEIDLYVDGYTPANQEITGRFAVYPAAKFKAQAGRYDNFLFHMGNSATHAYIYRALTETAGQGVLVLHDFVLHHFFIGQYLNNGKAPEYIRQMAKYYGSEGEKLAREVIKGRFAEALFGYPLNETAIEAARAVLVHSNYARDLIKQKYPDKTVGVARMGVPLPPDMSKSDARTRLGLPQNEFVIVSLGHLNPYKRLDSVLWAFRAFRREVPASRLILVGSESPNYNVRAMITALGLEKSVQLTGYASFEAMQDYTAAADACVNLRYPTAGETSASLLRIMGAGRPVLVSRTGAFEELPDDTCIKIDVDDAEEELLLEYLRLLVRRPELAHALGQNARRHVAVHARPTDAARDYFRFLSGELRATSYELEEASNFQLSAINPEQLDTEIIHPSSFINHQSDDNQQSSIVNRQLVEAIADIGMDEDDPVLEEIARAAKFSGLL
jgi:glycosyltransferase involved in cell wall biosynthesis